MENEKAALASLLTRYVRIWDEEQQDKNIREWIDRRMGERALIFEKIHSAFSLYGVDTKAADGFARLVDLFGQDGYNQILAQARNAGQPAPPPATQPVIAQDAAPEPLSLPTAGGTVRELTLGLLVDAGGKGIRASEIRAKIESLRNEVLHEKTVGMTLYRLSLDGLSRRTGRTWFYVPPRGAENPGGDTPGLINRQDEKGDEL